MDLSLKTEQLDLSMNVPDGEQETARIVLTTLAQAGALGHLMGRDGTFYGTGYTGFSPHVPPMSHPVLLPSHSIPSHILPPSHETGHSIPIESHTSYHVPPIGQQLSYGVPQQKTPSEPINPITEIPPLEPSGAIPQLRVVRPRQWVIAVLLGISIGSLCLVWQFYSRLSTPPPPPKSKPAPTSSLLPVPTPPPFPLK